jgi:hypothetical protein
MTESTELHISLSLEDGDQVELSELTHQLKLEIEKLNIDSINDTLAEGVPEGTKSVDWVSVGNFVVTLTPIIIPPLFNLLTSWINRRPSVPVKIKIKIGKNKIAQIEYDPTKTTAEDLENLVKTLGRSIKK